MSAEVREGEDAARTPTVGGRVQRGAGSTPVRRSGRGGSVHLLAGAVKRNRLHRRLDARGGRPEPLSSSDGCSDALSGDAETRLVQPPGPFDALQENEHGFAVADLVQALAARIGCSPAQLAIAWQRERPVTSIVLGARTLEQLEDNLGALDVEIPPDALAQLDGATRLPAESADHLVVAPHASPPVTPRASPPVALRLERGAAGDRRSVVGRTCQAHLLVAQREAPHRESNQQVLDAVAVDVPVPRASSAPRDLGILRTQTQRAKVDVAHVELRRTQDRQLQPVVERGMVVPVPATAQQHHFDGRFDCGH